MTRSIANLSRHDVAQRKKGLIVFIANELSLAYGCARALRDAGAELAVTYVNERAAPQMRPLPESTD